MGKEGRGVGKEGGTDRGGGGGGDRHIRHIREMEELSSIYN